MESESRKSNIIEPIEPLKPNKFYEFIIRLAYSNITVPILTFIFVSLFIFAGYVQFIKYEKDINTPDINGNHTNIFKIGDPIVIKHIKVNGVVIEKDMINGYTVLYTNVDGDLKEYIFKNDRLFEQVK